MPEHVVRLPLGVVRVKLERGGLGLGDRGGFEAQWAEDDAADALTSEAYREVVKAHMASVYKRQTGRSPGKVPLNLASHQLMDDLVGWSKLNASSR